MEAFGRRRFQFGLRTLLLCVFLASLGLAAYVAYPRPRADLTLQMAHQVLGGMPAAKVKTILGIPHKHVPGFEEGNDGDVYLLEGGLALVIFFDAKDQTVIFAKVVTWGY